MPDADRLDPLLAAVAATLRDSEPIGPAVETRVLAELGARRRREPVWRWLLRPREFRLSPVGALGLAVAMIVLAVAVLRLVSPAAAPAPVAVAPAPDRAHGVRFALEAPGSSRVTIVGDFNDWNPESTPLRRTSDAGVWEVVIPLEPGRYRYTFVVDGTRWLPDPAEPPALDEDFGTPTSIVTVAN